MRVSDLQGHAESIDEEAIGSTDRFLSDETQVDCPPDSSHGVPLADSDVTDESFADRDEQQELEVLEPPDNGVEAPTDNSWERHEPA